MIKSSIFLVVFYTIIQISKFIFILIDTVDYSPKKIEINPSNLRSINSNSNQLSAFISFVITMLAMLFSAISGAVASLIYSQNTTPPINRKDSEPWLIWLWSTTIESPGAITTLLALILIFEIFGFIIIYMLFKQKDSNIIKTVYDSIQAGELIPETLGRQYRIKLLEDVEKALPRHSLSKKYRSVAKHTNSKIIKSYISLCLLILSLFFIGIFTILPKYKIDNPIHVLIEIFIFYLVSITLLYFNYDVQKMIHSYKKKKNIPRI